MRSDSSLVYRLLRVMTSRQFFIVAFTVIGLAAGITVYNNSFREDRVTVNEKDKTTPQYAYRKDELALLKIALDKMMEAESAKRYEELYIDMGSRRFQHNVPQRVFLKMANCVEQHLGDMVSYDRNNHGFRREKRKGKLVDVLQLHVERSETPIEEQIVFEWDGVDVKFGGLYWMTDRRAFHGCINEVRSQKPHLEDTGALEGVEESTEKKSTAIQSQSDAVATDTTDSTTTSGTTESTQKTERTSKSEKKHTESPDADELDLKPGANPHQETPPPNTTTLQKEAGETPVNEFSAPANHPAPGDGAGMPAE